VFRLLDYTLGPDGQPVRRSTRVHNFLAISERARSFEPATTSVIPAWRATRVDAADVMRSE
jgi:hypothetical protein